MIGKKIKCHIDHQNERWWVLRNGKRTCCCCGAVVKKKKDMSRQDMERIKENIADIYPGKKLIVIMPGDEIPKELRP